MRGACSLAESFRGSVGSAIVSPQCIRRWRSTRKVWASHSKLPRIPQWLFLKLFHAAERSATDSLAGQLAEPPLDRIQPTGAGRRQVGGRRADDASTKFAPADACGCHTDPSPNAAGSRREIPGPDAQESQQFLVARAFETLSDDSSLPNFYSRKQGRCPMALVVVPHRAAANFLMGRPGGARSSA